MDAEGLSNGVGETGVAQVELDVEDVPVVRVRGESAVLLDMDGVSLDRQVGTQGDVGTVGLLENEALGRRLPAAQSGILFRLVLHERHETVRLQGLGQRRSDFLAGLGPRLGDFETLETLVQGIDGFVKRGLVALQERQLLQEFRGGLWMRHLEEGELNQESGSAGVGLVSRRQG